MKRLAAWIFCLFSTFSLVMAQSNDIALDFDGVDDYVETSYYGVLDSGARTLEAWINTSKNYDGNQGYKQGVIANYGDFSTSNRWTLNIYRKNSLRIEVQGNGLSGNIALNDGNWHHVAVTYDPKDTLDYRLYVDGKLDTAGNLTVPTNTAKNHPLIVGMRIDGINYFEGQIDEVRMYNYALSPTELNAYISKEYCSNPKGLVAYYKLNEGNPRSNNSSNKQADDYSGNYKHGDLKNFALSGTTSNWVDGAGLKGGPSMERVKFFDCVSVTSPSKKYVWTRDGTFRDTLTNVYGCDSVILASVNIGNDSNIRYIQSCGPYTSPKGIIADRDTFFTEYYTSVPGCDSIVSYSVSVREQFDTLFNINTCDQFNTPLGKTAKSDALLIDSFVTNSGCDSIVRYQIKINYKQYASDTVIGCDSATHLGITYYKSKLIQNTYQTFQGCDSIQTTLIRVNFSKQNTIRLDGCDSVVTTSGKTHYKNGTYQEYYQTIHGCDSTVSYDVHIHHPTYQIDTLWGCVELIHKGKLYTSNTLLEYKGQTSFGCDSVRDLQLMVININSTAEIKDSIIALNETTFDSIYWYDCADNQKLTTENLTDFVIPFSGRFKARIFYKDCQKWTQCYEAYKQNSVQSFASLGLLAYPNPSKGTFSIKGLQTRDIVNLYDVTGKKLVLKKVEQNGSILFEAPTRDNQTTLGILEVQRKGSGTYRTLIRFE